MPSARRGVSRCTSPIAPCSAISATRSDTISGTDWCAMPRHRTAAGWGNSAPLFGDERADYGQALQRHYDQGPPADWQSRFVTAYAAMHPWEDFAETWAHYLHIVDTLETAGAFGLSTRPGLTQGEELDTSVDFDPYRSPGMQQLTESWLPLTIAVNSLNRAMGQPDLYPFVLSAPALEKLTFVHTLVTPG